MHTSIVSRMACIAWPDTGGYIRTHMWNYEGGIIPLNVGPVARTCATWADRNITPCAVRGRACGVMHFYCVC